jgi:zinc protease
MQLPPLSEHRLGNGLRVVLVPHGFTPLVAIAVLYQVGSQEESSECAGVAHLVEHLAFGSSAYLEAEEFDRYCSDAGGTNNAYTTYSYTLYHMVLPAHQLELGLWLEASRMRTLPIPEEEFHLQQRVIIEEIKETVLNQPYGRWRELQAQQAFRPECPYHWEVYGSVETVAALSVEQAREFVRSYYRPDNACVVLCGNFASEQALELVEATLGQIPAPATPIPRRSFSPECRLGNRSVSFPDAVHLPAVFLSFHCGGYAAEEFPALELLAEVLGEGRSSRLYRALILESNRASSVGAFLDSRQWSSLLTVYAIAATPQTSSEMLQEALWQELQQLCKEGVAPEELLRCQRRLQTATAHRLQHPAAIAHEVAFSTVFWDNPERGLRLVEEYRHISAEQLHQLAQSVLLPENSVCTAIVPADA